MFPLGFRILLIDYDRVSLAILVKLLRSCLCKVTMTRSSSEALALLRCGNEFDLVLSAVHMPEMDGFELLDQIGIEMNIPFVMMSANDDEDLVRKGIAKGACDYLIKPIPFDKLKNIWQHTVQKKLNKLDRLTNIEPVDEPHKPSHEISAKNSKKRKEDDQKTEGEAEQNTSNTTALKRSKRLAWSDELKKQFEEAVNELGLEKAVPKKILERMNNPELTRENVASRLQKYRLSLNKPGKRTQKKNEPIAPIMIPSQTDFSSVTSYNGVDVQGLSISDLPLMPSLSTQTVLRKPFSPCTPEHYMPRQLPYFHQPFQMFHNMGMQVGEGTLKFSDSLVPDANSIGYLETYGRHISPFMGQQVYDGGLAYNPSVPQPYPKIPVIQFPEHSLRFKPTPQMLHPMGSSAPTYYHEAHQNLDAAYEAMPVNFEAPPTSFIQQGFVHSKNNGENIDASIGCLQQGKDHENLEGNVQDHHTTLVSDINSEKLVDFNDDSSTLIALEGYENAANSLLTQQGV